MRTNVGELVGALELSVDCAVEKAERRARTYLADALRECHDERGDPHPVADHRLDALFEPAAGQSVS